MSALHALLDEVAAQEKEAEAAMADAQKWHDKETKARQDSDRASRRHAHARERLEATAAALRTIADRDEISPETLKQLLQNAREAS